jgi:hypothetical protein
VVAAVDLHEHSFTRHPLAPAAVERRTATTWTGKASLYQNTTYSGPGAYDAFPLGQKLRYMSVVEADVRGPR